MSEKTAVISLGGEQKAQIQLVDREGRERVANLYSASGTLLCAVPFQGDDDMGFSIGKAAYDGYVAGWENCHLAVSRNVTKALFSFQDNTKI